MGNTSEKSMLASAWPGATAAFGTMLIVIGLVWPGLANPASTVTEQQAEEYYEASTALEQAAASYGHRQRRARQPGKEELDAARKRFDSAKQEVAAAKTSRKKLAFWLKIAGGALAIVGVGGLLLQRSDE